MKRVDLHTHSTFSDGTYTPCELVKYAEKKGLSAIALTDHDTVEGIDEVMYYGEKYGVETVSGVELSASYDEVSVHLVGLFVDNKNTALNARLNELKLSRTLRNERMVEKLRSIGIDISLADVQKRALGGIVTRAHIASELTAKGYTSSNAEAFDRYITKGKPGYVKRESLDYKEAIKIILESGGIPVFAHPLLCHLSDVNLKKVIRDMSEQGLKAIEAYYSTHKPNDTKYISTLAGEYGLLLSGGSDFHGANKPKIDLGTGYGNLEVPYDVLLKLKELKDSI